MSPVDGGNHEGIINLTRVSSEIGQPIAETNDTHCNDVGGNTNPFDNPPADHHEDTYTGEHHAINTMSMNHMDPGPAHNKCSRAAAEDPITNNDGKHDDLSAGAGLHHEAPGSPTVAISDDALAWCLSPGYPWDTREELTAKRATSLKHAISLGFVPNNLTFHWADYEAPNYRPRALSTTSTITNARRLGPFLPYLRVTSTTTPRQTRWRQHHI